MARRTREIWRNLIGQFERSGQSREKFAGERKIPLGTLQYWIYRLRRERREEVTTLLPVRVIASTAPTARWPGDDAAVIEAALGDDVRLRFPTGTPPNVIAEVIGLLRARC